MASSVISVMLAVKNAEVAFEWYERALGATRLWDIGPVVGMLVLGAPLFLGEPGANGWESPEVLGMPSCRIEVFCDDPDGLIARALAAGASAGSHSASLTTTGRGAFIGRARSSIRSGTSRFVGDQSPLEPHPG